MLFRTLKQKIERVNTYTHMFGLFLAIPAIIVLLVFASIEGGPTRIVSFSVYGFSLCILYLFSTLYHGSKGHRKKIFQQLDHIAIYLLIAGSYTPFTLLVLQGAWGWTLFGIVWGLALVGIVIDSLYRKGPRIVQMVIYFTMGWLILVGLYPLIDNLATGGLVLLFAGGLFYSVGVIFYRLDVYFRYGHGIWHLFVLAGSICHYLAMLFYML
ncbi:MAG: hemolysin III family protein [Gammaproteobacteria bacterium]|nr:hemolysin III family protein [Gammaproteobacteria bacterium]